MYMLQIVMRTRHFLPELLREHFALGYIPPVPSLSYDQCPKRLFAEPDGTFTFVEDVWIMVDFSLP